MQRFITRFFKSRFLRFLIFVRDFKALVFYQCDDPGTIRPEAFKEVNESHPQ